MTLYLRLQNYRRLLRNSHHFGRQVADAGELWLGQEFVVLELGYPSSDGSEQSIHSKRRVAAIKQVTVALEGLHAERREVLSSITNLLKSLGDAILA